MPGGGDRLVPGNVVGRGEPDRGEHARTMREYPSELLD